MKKTGNDFSDRVAHSRQIAGHYLNDYLVDGDDRCLIAHALLKSAADLWSDGTRHSHEIAHRAYVIAQKMFGDYLDDRHPELVG